MVASNGQSALPALVPFVTNLLLDRTARVVWQLPVDALNGWSKQRALALCIASISGGRLPSWADAERPGQRMHRSVGLYRQRHQKLVVAEKAAIRRAQAAGREQVARSEAHHSRVLLEEEQFHCSYGCTPMSVSVRRVPPGMRAQAVEQVQTSIFEENRQLCDENRSLKRLETTAVDVLKGQLVALQGDLRSSVFTESTCLGILDSERQKRETAAASCVELSAEAAAMSKENQCLQRQVEQKEKQAELKIQVLGAKVARAHLDFVQAEQAGEQKRQKLERERASVDVSLGVRERELADAREELKAIREEIALAR